MEISNWLKGKREWHTGILLYEKFGSKEFLKKTFKASGPTPFNCKKLLEELKALAPATVTQIKPEPPAAAKPKVDFKAKDKARLNQEIKGFDAPFITMPKEIQQLLQKSTALYNSLAKMHRELRLNKKITALDEWQWDYLKPAERKERALAIAIGFRSDAPLQQMWNVIKYYKDTGNILKQEKPKVPVPNSLAQIMVELQRKRTARSKLKLRMKDASAKEKKEIVPEIEKLNILIEALAEAKEKKLKAR